MLKSQESIQIKRARRKLKKQLQEEEKQITPQALQKMSQSIHQWISRHSDDRIQLKDKNITLFDANQHSAKIKSKFIDSLLKELSKENELSKSDSSVLDGRIKNS